MEWNEKNLLLAKWLIDKTNTKDYRIGNLSGMKHPKVDGDLLKTVGGREELVRQAKVLERIPALGGEEYLYFDWREMNTSRPLRAASALPSMLQQTQAIPA